MVFFQDVQQGSSSGRLNFYKYIDVVTNLCYKLDSKTSMIVAQEAAIEFVISIFKKIGPRYVVVGNRGKIVGLITKKDILVAIDGGIKEERFPLYTRVDGLTEEDSSLDGPHSELSYVRRIRKWKVHSRPSELSAQVELQDMH